MRGAAAGLLLIAATTLLAHGQASAPGPETDPLIHQRRLAMVMRLAVQDYEAGNYQAATARLDALQGKAAEDLGVMNLRGAILTKAGDFEGATKAFQSILAADPGNFPAAFNLGEAKFMQGNYPGALEAFRELHRRDPRNELLRFKIILCQLSLGQEDEARKMADILIPAGSTPAWYYAQAALAKKAGDQLAAARNLQAAQAIYEAENCKLFDESMDALKF